MTEDQILESQASTGDSDDAGKRATADDNGGKRNPLDDLFRSFLGVVKDPQATFGRSNVDPAAPRPRPVLGPGGRSPFLSPYVP